MQELVAQGQEENQGSPCLSSKENPHKVVN